MCEQGSFQQESMLPHELGARRRKSEDCESVSVLLLTVNLKCQSDERVVQHNLKYEMLIDENAR